MNKIHTSIFVLLLSSASTFPAWNAWETIKSHWPWSFKADPVAQELVQQLTDTFVKFSFNNEQFTSDYCKKNQAFVDTINNIISSKDFSNYMPTAQGVPKLTEDHDENTACPTCQKDLADAIFSATAVVQSVHDKITKTNIQHFLQAIDLFLHQYDTPHTESSTS